MEKKKKPAIRFKGFTDSWEQRKLGDIATDMIAGGDVDKDLILDEGRYPVIANALTNDGIVGYYNNEYRIKAPAVTITGRGDVGHAKARNVDFTPVVRLLSLKSNHDVFFLENAINTLKIVIESTGVPQLTVPQLAKYEVTFPKTLNEEEKIGQYFANLDHLITLHQREFKYVYYRFIINKYKYISESYICIYTKIYGGLKMNNKLELYHGSGQIVEFPEIRKTRYTKDFSWGFYCTKSYEQAYRWAERKHENGIVNVYSYIENSELNIKKFDGMCEEWLDFIAECRAGKTHPYDIVEGPMADDTIWNFVNDYLNKNISKEVFWEYARFKHPSHQISFHSIRALECLKYERSIAVENDTVE